MTDPDRPSSTDDSQSLSPRLLRMRGGLVAAVEAIPFEPRRRSRGFVAAAISAFVVAGALAGGLTAAAAVSTSSSDDLRNSLATTARYDVESGAHGKLVGTPSFEVASGNTQIRLGAPPAGVNAVEVAFQCLDPGTFAQGLNAVDLKSDSPCHKSSTMMPSTTTPASSGYRLTSRAAQTLTVVGSGTARYAVWVSWAALPVSAAASPQQEEEVADGRVTRDEYIAAFGRLEGCMAQAGHPFGLIPRNETVYQYSLTDASVAVFDNECYPREFEQVDTLWQGEHPQ